MASYNRVILMGNVTRDIQLRYTPAGTPVTEVGLAVNDRRKNQSGDWVDETTFVDVTFWGRTAEVASEYLSKGSPVFVEGRLKLDTWEKDGQKNYKLRVVADRMQLLGGRDSGRGGSGGDSAGNQYQAPASQAPQDNAPQDNVPQNNAPQNTAPPASPEQPSSIGDDIPF